MFAPFQSFHRLFQHFHVEAETDGVDVTVLLFAEQFPGATDFQILAGQHEAGAQVGGLFDGLQALECVLTHRLGAGGDQVGVGLVMAAAHAAS